MVTPGTLLLPLSRNSYIVPFFKHFLPSLTGPTIIAAGTDDYATAINSIKTFADGFITIVAKYTPADGGRSGYWCSVECCGLDIELCICSHSL